MSTVLERKMMMAVRQVLMCHLLTFQQMLVVCKQVWQRLGTTCLETLPSLMDFLAERPQVQVNL